ncbi:acyltransferase domain-containing protein, partial [Paracraurococcus ruber]
MAALGAAAGAAAPVLAGLGRVEGRGLEIAAINAPDSLTVAGPAPLLARLEQVAAERRWSFVALDLDYAFHSAAMDPVRDGLLADLAGLRAADPAIPLLSTVTAAPLDAAGCTAAHWWRNLREPVRFLDAVRAAAARGPCLVIEIGPTPVLQSYLREALRAAGSEAAVLPSLSRRDPAPDPFPGIADRAWAAGADPRGAAAHAGPATRRGLPHTPFDRAPHWYPTTVEALHSTAPVEDHPLLGFRRGAAPGLWTRHIDTALDPWLADHRLAGAAVLPAAAMWEMALAAGRACHPDAPAIELREAMIRAALPLEEATTRELRANLDAAGRFTLDSRRRLSAEDWTLHLEAMVAPLPALPVPVSSPALPAAMSPPALPAAMSPPALPAAMPPPALPAQASSPAVPAQASSPALPVPVSSPAFPAQASAPAGPARASPPALSAPPCHAAPPAGTAPPGGQPLAGDAIRARARQAGLDYGPAFAALDQAWVDDAAGTVRVALDRPQAAPPDAGFLLHPARLDGALQGLVGLLAGAAPPPGSGGGLPGIVPVRVARLVARVGAAPAALADLRLTHRGERSAIADLVLRDAAGRPVALLDGCTLQRIRLPGAADPAEAAFRVELQPALPLPGQEAGARPGLAASLDAARRRDAALEMEEAALLLDGVGTAGAHAALSAQAPPAGPLARRL